MHPFPHPPHLPARALAPSHSRERELASMRVGRWGGGGAGCVDCARASQAAGCVCAGGTSVGGVATRQQQWGAAGAVGLGHAPPPLHSTRAHLPPPPCCRCCCSMRGLSAITPQRPWVPDVVHTPCLACATHPPPPSTPRSPPRASGRWWGVGGGDERRLLLRAWLWCLLLPWPLGGVAPSTSSSGWQQGVARAGVCEMGGTVGRCEAACPHAPTPCHPSPQTHNAYEHITTAGTWKVADLTPMPS